MQVPELMRTYVNPFRHSEQTNFPRVTEKISSCIDLSSTTLARMLWPTPSILLVLSTRQRALSKDTQTILSSQTP